MLVLVLAAATVLEKIHGTTFALQHVYSSPWFVALWVAASVAAICYLWCKKLYKQPAVLLLHISFALILCGALITHLSGVQGSVHLRQSSPEAVHSFITADGNTEELPFSLSLTGFSLEYYPGTVAPMDFVSRFIITDGEEKHEMEVSMNNICRYRHYRFYQARYDSDRLGTTLSVSYDPMGIGVTYAGYVLLLVSAILLLCGRSGGFRSLLRHPLLRAGAASALLLMPALPAAAASEKSHVLPEKTAAAFGDLYVYYNDRICPLQTLAKDFVVKLSGNATYKGFTPEQVFTACLFYYDDWKAEPFIYIRSKEIRDVLGIDGKYACLADFIDTGGYKLDNDMLQGLDPSAIRAAEETNEKFSLFSMAATGSLWKLYPYAAEDSLSGLRKLTWLSLADRMPYGMPAEEQIFVRNSMNYISELVARKDFAQVEELSGKIRKYQEQAAAGFLPSSARFNAEKLYNRLNDSRPLAMASLVLGILSFIYYCRLLIKGRHSHSRITTVLLTLLGVEFLCLCVLISLRGIVSGHLPMSNGHEMMQLTAASAALLTFFFHRKLPVAVAFGFLLCGLALLVSMMGESNPQVTQLMPVLSSPLLCLHVAVIMLAYSLLAFIMLNGITAMVLYVSRQNRETEVERLHVLSRILLYPAVLLLAAGIFIGAVWANLSWGRYWGWDPKEVWALITLLVYAFAFHRSSLPLFRSPMFFHAYSIAAFLCVIITYFGVNFLLGGMHSYA